MLQPKRTKYRKYQRGRMKGIRTRGSAMQYGEFGLKAEGPGWVSAREIEAARRAITGYVKRGGQLWIRLFPDKPVSARPAETRMGGGKGAVDRWVAVVKRGRMLYEIADVPEEAAREALRRAAHKLSVPTRIVARTDEL
ncbi:MAG: 50S ribosomal protein L16 [Chloroflexota bacterium]